ncbi:hypothetical protein CEXT_328221 [Caerostris extrusa]|uniref:Uncharacterized protein n=1 Tax=Caerostris extrusa TaxID=172846 RepID=A0AAV4TJT9_CAEEX|nr:hypothetical protein CEXT_328221 [Caerostris extrusa]
MEKQKQEIKQDKTVSSVDKKTPHRQKQHKEREVRVSDGKRWDTSLSRSGFSSRRKNPMESDDLLSARDDRKGKIPKELKKEQLCAGIKTGFSRFHLSCKKPTETYFSPFFFIIISFFGQHPSSRDSFSFYP